MGENVTLVQLMDSLGNVNHATIIVGCWIFDSNYKKELCLTQVSMDLICSPSVVGPYFMLLDTFGRQFVLKRINMTLSSKILNT